MPSHHSHKGVKKLHLTTTTSTASYKNFFNVFQKKNHCPAPIPSMFLPQWFTFTPVAPPPVSKEFDTNDCIWYYGTLYVKEAVAVAHIKEQQQIQQHQHQQTQQQQQ